MIIGRFRVANSGRNPRYPGAVRVYLDGKKIAEVAPSAFDPLKYLRAHPESLYCDSLRGQLRDAGATQIEINEILIGEK